MSLCQHCFAPITLSPDGDPRFDLTRATEELNQQVKYLKVKEFELNEEIDLMADGIDRRDRDLGLLKVRLGDEHFAEHGCPDCHTSLMGELNDLKTEVAKLKQELKNSIKIVKRYKAKPWPEEDEK